ncbi:MAG: hypothetical protein R2747_10030 [Pyrinomonadaceae bacterium]
MKFKLSILLLMFFTCSANLMAGMIYDETFDDDGLRVANPFDGSNRRGLASTIEILPDGKYLIGGSAQSVPNVPSQTAFAVQRLNPDGTPDTAFGTNGRALFIFDANAPLPTNVANVMAVQADGKILLAGYTASSQPFDSLRATVIRLNADGTIDSTFANSGVFRSPNVGNGNIESDSKFFDLKILPNGNILAVGNVVFGNSSNEPCQSNQSPWCSSATVLSANGTFLSRTNYKFTPEPGAREVITDVEIQSDGKWLAVISSEANTAPFRIVRFDSNGALDGNFAVNGVATITSFFGSNNILGYSVEIQPDGKILAGGKKNNAVVTARFNPNGTLDNSYGVNGLTDAIINESQNIAGYDILLQPDGKILSVGANKLIRFLPNGGRDLSFGPDGELNIAPDQTTAIGSVYPIDLARHSDGRIVFAARTTLTAPGAGAVDSWTIGRLTNSNQPRIDFDGDGKTDISIFRPSGGQWWYLRSSDGGNRAFQFGTSTDKLVPADYTGDGKTDIAFWRESTGEWFILRSEDSSFYSFPFGALGDIPVPADFDGDGQADPAIFRSSNSTWFILRSSDSGTTITSFGAAGDLPVAADYDGDGRSDIAIFRPSDGSWWLNRSQSGLIVFSFGTSTDKTVPEDYTGDGLADVAFWRPSTGEWFVLRSEDSSFYSFPFGAGTDVPSPGDFDGDGRADPAVFRPSGATWFIQGSTSGTQIRNFGLNGDVPVPSVFPAS